MYPRFFLAVLPSDEVPIQTSLMHNAAEQHEDESHTSPEGILKKYRKSPWWLVLLVVAIPPLITSYFSYRAAKVEAQMKANETKAEAEAGYAATKVAVEELQKNDKEYSKAIAELSGHVRAVESFLTIHAREEHSRAPSKLHLPPAMHTQAVQQAAATRVEMPMDLKSALIDVNSGKVYKIGKVYEGPEEDSPDWTRGAMTAPASSEALSK